MEFAGMELERLLAWVLIGTIAGAAARQLVQGKQHWGLWGDMFIAFIGGFIIGWALTELELDLSANIMKAQPDIDREMADLVTVFLATFLGGLIFRIILKFMKQ